MSRPDRGSINVLGLESFSALPSHVGAALPDDQPDGARQLRFLVVDDSEDIRDAICSLIRRTGHLARNARDGQEAVEILQRESFDVMLLDLLMPRMGGVEVLDWLQTHPEVAPAMRVVVVSASAEESREPLAERGVTSVIQKPFRLQQLMGYVFEAVAAARR